MRHYTDMTAYEEKITAYLVGHPQLSEYEVKELELHIQECEDCMDFFLFSAKVANTLRAQKVADDLRNMKRSGSE